MLQNKLKILFCLTLLLLSLWLSGCVSLENDITIYGQEAWLSNMRIDVPPNTLTLMGGESGFEYATGLPSTGQGTKEGIAFTWEKERRSDGSVIYTLTTQGSGFNKLNKVAFDGKAKIFYDDNNYVNIQYRPQPELVTYVLRITGGKIVNSNANRVEGGTAIWQNPTGEITVTLTEAVDYENWLLIGGAVGSACLCFLMLALLVGRFIAYRRKNAQNTQPPYQQYGY